MLFHKRRQKFHFWGVRGKEGMGGVKSKGERFFALVKYAVLSGIVFRLRLRFVFVASSFKVRCKMVKASVFSLTNWQGYRWLGL